MNLQSARYVAMSALLLVVCVSPFCFGAVHPIFYTTFQVTLFGLAAAVIAAAVLAPRKPYPTGVAFVCVPAAAFALLAAVQLLPLPAWLVGIISPNTISTLRAALPWKSELHTARISLQSLGTQLSAFQLIACLAVFVLTVGLFNSRRRRLVLAWSFTATGLMLALVGLYQHWHSPGKVYGFWESIHGGVHFGPFVNRNHFAGYLEMILPITAALITVRRLPGERMKPHSTHTRGTLRWYQVAALGSFIVMLIAVVVSLSRGGMIAVAAAGCVMSAVAWRKKALRSAGTTLPLIFAIGFLLGAWFAGPQLLGRLRELRGAIASPMEETRTIATLRALKLLGQYPIFGTGLGSFQAVFTSVQTPELGLGLYRYAHNDWAQLATETGLLGVAIAVVFAIGLARIAHRRLRRSGAGSAWWLTLGATGSLAALAVHSAVDFNLHIPSNAFLASAVAGFLLVCSSSSHMLRPRPPLARRRPVLATGLVLAVVSSMGALIYVGIRHYQSEALLRHFDPSSQADRSRLLLASRYCPSNPRPYFLLFGLHARMAQEETEDETSEWHYTQANMWARRALELSPTCSLYHERLGRLYYWGNRSVTAEDLEAAELHLTRATEFDPAFPEWILSLADFYLETGRFSKADETYTRLLELDPSRTEQVAVKLAKAGTSAERMRAILPESVEASVALGEYMLSQGQLDDAAASFTKACELARNEPTAKKKTAALLLAKTGQTAAARKFLETWMRESNDAVPYLLALADIAQLEDDAQLRIDYVTQAVQKAPGDARNLVALAEAWAAAGDWVEALTYYEKAYRHEPRSEELCESIVACLNQLQRPDEALEVAREFVHRRPRSADALVRVADLLLEQGRVVEAIDYYEQARKLKPDKEEYKRALKAAMQELEKLRHVDRSETGR